MAHSGFSNVLKNGGFQAFLWTQFLGAFNDSVYQTIVALHVGNANPAYVPLVPAVFTLPSLLFSGYSGHLADLVSKRRVLIGVKLFEIAIMLFGLTTLMTGWTEGMLLVVFLMGLHAAIFSPAKYGIVPEMLADRDLSRGNALLEMSTFVAIVLGIAGGGVLFAVWKAEPWRIGAATLAIAAIGFATSLRITRVPASGATQPFRWNPFGEIAGSTRHLLHDKPLWLAVLGVSYFWFAGVLLKTDLQYFGRDVLRSDDSGVSLLWAFLAIGIGVGNMLAGRLSGDKVELGLVPMGAAFMGFFALALVAARHSFALSAAAVVFLAMASGLFVVPLYAYIQQRSDAREKGRVVAANNFYQTIGMLVSSGVMSLCYTSLHLGAATIMLGFGLSMLLLTVYIVTVVPDYLVRFVLWLLTHSFFRIRINGQENVPFQGPALLVANHMSHVDGLLVGASVQRFIRFMVWKPFFDMKAFHWFLRLSNAIPVGTGGGRDAVESIRAARREIAAGHIVCIFAEGAISRTGNMRPFKRGMEKIVDGTDVPIIPVHLDRLWGSIFSFAGGKFFWKWPKRIPYPVTVSFGAPLPSNSSAQAVRQAIQELSADATADRQRPGDLLDRRLIHVARRNWSKFAMADTTGPSLTYGETLTASVLLGRLMSRERVCGAGCKGYPLGPAGWQPASCAGNQPARSLPSCPTMVGVLLPSTVAGALVNLSLTLRGAVPVNLNFTAGADAMQSAIDQCGIRTVIASRAFLAKAKIDPLPGTVYIEDLLKSATPLAKLRAYLAARFAPAALLSRGGRTPDSLAGVIFSSGSTGVPKGVMLSHYNLISNIDAIAQLFWINSSDRLVGVLPFFHSFGLTVTIWFPLLNGCGVVYHPNPTDARAIGELVQQHKATLLLTTPTFCSTYIRKCSAEEFASLRYVLVGAEKLRLPIANAFREKFGVELLEGYGCTEMSPVVAVNAPDFSSGKDTQTGNKPGTVGHPLPGVAARIVDPVTFGPLPPNTEGLLLVKGSNRMLGYLNQPERTAEVFRDGWYITGDIALLDDEGFLRITDRLSRFSKIAGEMVPHLKVEEAILNVLGDAQCVVTGIPDDLRGERLVVLYVHPTLTPAELYRQISETDMPRLWIPKRENIHPVEALPQLGTGKLDLRGVRNRAQELGDAGLQPANAR
jgi:acyl-[acyl-carrier-protein]-phospholipid O-acyltransferase / long-chain-fatty-acid--[acyl-carrier-protein] ligase